MNHDTNQGRIGMESVNASRAIFGMRPITEDEPIRVPLSLKVLCALAVIFCIVVISGALDCYFPKVNPQCQTTRN